MTASCIYHGHVWHERRTPVHNTFRYPLFLMFIDLAELESIFNGHPLWSARRPAPAWFRREDYLEPRAKPLIKAVHECARAHTGREPEGPVRMLTHLRYFGHCFNPVTFYFCYDKDGERPEIVISEITNTPWRQRHQYVLDLTKEEKRAGKFEFRFRKNFHISPFMPMDIDYLWRIEEPGARFFVHMAAYRQEALRLSRQEITRGSLTRLLLRYPVMTLQVVARIYWQALVLQFKRSPVYDNPSFTKDGGGTR